MWLALNLRCRRSHGHGLFRMPGFGFVFIKTGAFPELAGRLHRINVGFRPPGGFIAHPVHQPMMDSTERDREFVAHLAAERARLREAEMMWIRWLAAADEAGLGGDETKVRLVAIAPGLGDRQDALVDAFGLIVSGNVGVAACVVVAGGLPPWQGLPPPRLRPAPKGRLIAARMLPQRAWHRLLAGCSWGEHPTRPDRRCVGLRDAGNLAQ
jgi:hypothetical protein